MANLQLPNPSSPQQTVAALVAAVNADEAAATALAATVSQLSAAVAALQSPATKTIYTAAGAIAGSGRAILKAGSAAAMTLAAPASDNLSLVIVAADAFQYTVAAAATGLLSGFTKATFAGQVGNGLSLISSGGVWLTVDTPYGVALT